MGKTPSQSFPGKNRCSIGYTKCSHLFRRASMQSPPCSAVQSRIESDLDLTYLRMEPPPPTAAHRDDRPEKINNRVMFVILQESQASQCLQVQMNPKEPSGWHFTCDFRESNVSTVSLKWTIPNIHDMLDKMGGKRPEFFGKTDLTSEYPPDAH